MKLLKNIETTDLWYREDGVKLKQEYGLLYVRSILTGIKKIIDKGGVTSVPSSEPSSVTGSLEKDMRYYTVSSLRLKDYVNMLYLLIKVVD